MIQHFTYTTARGHSMGVSHYGGDLPTSAPTVVYLHGFKGFKDWGFVPYLGECLVAKGLRLLTMNFSHNGVEDHGTDFTQLERFRENTFSLELEEALEVMGKYYRGELFGMPARVRMGLLGHSRGGGLALLAAEQAPVEAVCTWAAVSTFARYPQVLLEQWRKQGYLEVQNARTGQVMHLGYGLHQDLMANLYGPLDIQGAVRKLSKPLCIIHGQADEAVPEADARAIYEWADSTAVELHLIPDAGHTFGARHPFDKTNPHLEDCIGHTLAFFNQHLCQSL